MSNRLSHLGALAAFIVAAFLTPFSRVAGSKGKNFYLSDFCIMKCKMALLLSAFAFAPSVLAADIPVVTLSAENIQTRAEWRVVGDGANRFRMDGNVLILQSHILEQSGISGAGKPNGARITANVEVLDKFSTLNPLYADLTTRVKITTVIMGCHAHRSRRIAKSYFRRDSQPPQQMVVYSGSMKTGDIIRRTVGPNGNFSYILNTVTTHGTHSLRNRTLTYITTSPSLFGALGGWDQGFSQVIYNEFPVNDAANCFDKDFESVQEQNQNYLIQQEKNQYLADNAPPLNTGVYAGDKNINARVISVASAVVDIDDNEQIFYLDDAKLASILIEQYPIKIINDGGKAFIIDRSSPVSDTRYEYVTDLTAASDGVTDTTSHEVIILADSFVCPATPPVSVQSWKITPAAGASLRIQIADISKVESYPYVLIGEKVYKFNGASAADGLGQAGVSAEDSDGNSFDASDFSFSTSPGMLTFADHFLCESI